MDAAAWARGAQLGATIGSARDAAGARRTPVTRGSRHARRRSPCSPGSRTTTRSPTWRCPPRSTRSGLDGPRIAGSSPTWSTARCAAGASADFLVDRFLTSDPPPPARRALRLGRLPAGPTARHPDLRGGRRHRAGVAQALPRARQRRAPPGRRCGPGVDGVSRRAHPALLSRLDRRAAAGRPRHTGPDARRRPRGHERAAAVDRPARRLRAGPRVAVGRGTGRGRAGRSGRGRVRRSRAERRRRWPTSARLVVAADLQQHRVGLIARNAERPRVSTAVRPVVADAPATTVRAGHRPTASCSTPRVRGSGCSAVDPTPAGGSTPAAPDRLAVAPASTSSMPPFRSSGPAGPLVYSVCTLTDAESIDGRRPHRRPPSRPRTARPTGKPVAAVGPRRDPAAAGRRHRRDVHLPVPPRVSVGTIDGSIPDRRRTMSDGPVPVPGQGAHRVRRRGRGYP